MRFRFRNLLKTVMLCLLICATSGPAGATNATLEQAQQALVTGQFTTAQGVARQIETDHPVDAALIFARASLELGQLDAAMEAAHLAQTRAPKLAQARVMVALVHIRKGQPRRAMFALRRALDFAGSNVERAGIESLLRNIQTSLRFRFSGGIGFAPSTNIANVASNRTIVFEDTGMTATYNPDATVKSGVGLRSWLGASYVLGNPVGQSLTFSGQVLRNDYDDKSFSNQQRSLGIAWGSPINGGRQKVNVNYQFAELRNDGSENHSNTLIASILLPLDGKTAGQSRNLLRLTASRQIGKYPTGVLDFGTNRLGGSYFWQTAPGTAWQIGFNVSDRNSGSNVIANRSISMTAGVRKMFPTSGLRLGLSGRISAARWDNVEFRMSTRRWERDVQTTFRVGRPQMTFYGFSPYAELSYTDRRSNQTIREFNSLDLFIGIQNGF